jgi:hypothetical protein
VNDDMYDSRCVLNSLAICVPFWLLVWSIVWLAW